MLSFLSSHENLISLLQTGHTALQRAAAEGHLEIVKTLLENGISVDHQDEVDRVTALHLAAQHGFSQTVSMLCDHSANVYIKNRSGFGALHVACQHGHNQTCRVLLINGCRPDIKNNVRNIRFNNNCMTQHSIVCVNDCLYVISTETPHFTRQQGTDTRV